MKKPFILTAIILISGLYQLIPTSSSSRLFAQEEGSDRKAVEAEKIVRNWFYPHYIKDQLVWEAKGEIAIFNTQSEVKVKSVKITYHLPLRHPGRKPPNQPNHATDNPTSPLPAEQTEGRERLIKFKADEGIIKKEENLAIFKGNVSVRTHNNTELTTEEITSSFYPDKDELMISSNAVVTCIHQADMLIKGKGLKSENNLRIITWLKDVEATLSGTNFSLFSPVTPTAYASEAKSGSETYPNTSYRDKTPQLTTITCAGPFVIKEILGSDIIKGHKLIFKNNAELTKKFSAHPPAAGGSVSKSNPSSPSQVSGLKELKLNSHLLEIITLRENRDEIMVLKGKKRVVFYIKGRSTAGNGNGEASTSVKNKSLNKTSKISITCRGNVLIYPDFQRIVFQDRVQLTQTNESTGTNGKEIITCDRLTIVLDTAHNEIKKVLAEHNISLFAKGGSRASAQQLEWHPIEHSLVLKSATDVKLWHQNKHLTGDEVIIRTGVGGLGSWEKIKIRNRNGSSGAIKIAPPKKE